MGRLPTTFKVCQTCRYWNGVRNIDGHANLVESISDKGTCVNKNSFYNQKMSKMATCSHFEPII